MTVKDLRRILNKAGSACPDLSEALVMVGLDPDMEQSLCLILPETLSGPSIDSLVENLRGSRPGSRSMSLKIVLERRLLWIKS